MHKFDFEKAGRAYVPIFIKPFDKTTLLKLFFKVDTGADTSTISKQDLVSLGYTLDWIHENVIIFEEKDKPETASGEKVDAGFIQIPLLNILGYEGRYWPFQIILDENRDYRNLLGRDLLSGFNYWFNNVEDYIELERVPCFKARYTFLPKQEIHEIISQ